MVSVCPRPVSCSVLGASEYHYTSFLRQYQVFESFGMSFELTKAWKRGTFSDSGILLIHRLVSDNIGTELGGYTLAKTNKRFTYYLNFCVLILLLTALEAQSQIVFPGASWENRRPSELGLKESNLKQLAESLDGRGCVIKDGYVVTTWGDQAKKSDWLSSAKPVLSTLLFFAVHEGLVKSVDQPIADFGWDLKPKDQQMAFRHLANMISGYARPESPGTAWAYNDYAIQFYQKTLFDRVFKNAPEEAAMHPKRLGALQLEDGLSFSKGKRRLSASVRDFARIAWFWLNKGKWQGAQVLPRRFFDDYMKPHTPKDLPHTAKADTDDYLGIGSFGGGSDHFTNFGAGIYGFNWWFNDTGRLHPESLTWPDAPRDTIMSIGAGGNCSVLIPSKNLLLVCARGNWGKLKAGDPQSKMNQLIKILADSSVKKWETITIDFQGPRADAMDDDPNPHLDYRLQVHFTSPGGKTYNVPGYFDGDGQGGQSGNVWRVRFSPDEVGEWNFRASFRKGAEIAVSLDPDAGEPASFDGYEGSLVIVPQDSSAPGFLKWGRLEYVGKHYLKFRDGSYWIKGGADSPEDFLAYHGFENTPEARHNYDSHVKDWQPGDPDWGDGKGKGIIGALNYLASQHVNSIYFLPMNIGGDGKNVWPYMGEIDGGGSVNNDNLHFDISKLRQWEIVFDHAQRKGIFLHFVLNEAEKPNKRELDDSELGVERKLFYRELVARFGHHLALQWNLSEEYNIGLRLPPELVKSYAQYIHDIDPYDHPITVHHASTVKKAWTPFLGDRLFPVTSFQTQVLSDVDFWFKESESAGFPQVVGMDELHPDHCAPDNADRHRREYIWGIYLSGGIYEAILDNLTRTEDFRRYEQHWQNIWHARRFMEQNLPFWEMRPMDELITGESQYTGEVNVCEGQVFAKEGEIYAIYLPNAEETGILDLSKASGKFIQRWYNPRTGEFDKSSREIKGGKSVELGPPPEQASEDWVALITRTGE